MKVVGLMNIQYAIYKDVVYILEANPRASRTVPLVSKICNIPMAKLATEIVLGKKLGDFDLKRRKINHFGVKEAVFPFNMFPDVDPVLGPEMRSTGEVLGMANSFGLAFFKSQEATKTPLPTSGTVLITIADRDKDKILQTALNFKEMGFKIMATGGTKDFLEANGIQALFINKLHEHRPNIIDALVNGHIDLVINTGGEIK
jgi:carbamoyl-phosphate synthase large subunit